MEPALFFPRGRQPSFAELERLADDQLMASLKDGCAEALAVLFDRYHRLVFSIALRIVRDRAEAEDVVQNVFLEIFRSVAQFDPSKGTTKVWAQQYAYHRAINRRQYLNARNYYSQINIEDSHGILSNQTLLFGRLRQSELKHLLQEGLATLSGAQKRVIELASYDGLSMKEIADKTGESFANVRHHYYRGLKKLRAFVTDTPMLRKAAGDE